MLTSFEEEDKRIEEERLKSEREEKNQQEREQLAEKLKRNEREEWFLTKLLKIFGRS